MSHFADHVSCPSSVAPTTGPNGETLYRCFRGHLHAFMTSALFCDEGAPLERELEVNARKLVDSATSGEAA